MHEYIAMSLATASNLTMFIINYMCVIVHLQHTNYNLNHFMILNFDYLLFNIHYLLFSFKKCVFLLI